MAPKKSLNVSANPLPISFKDFAKNPIVGTLFLVIVGISALYVDIRSNFNSRIDDQEYRIKNLEFKDSLKTQVY